MKVPASRKHYQEFIAQLCARPEEERVEYPLSGLAISTRVETFARRYGVQTLADLLDFTAEEVQTAWGMGDKTYKELVDLLKQLNLRFDTAEERRAFLKQLRAQGLKRSRSL